MAEQKALATLAQIFPSSTDAERKRFLRGRRGNLKQAYDKLKEFLEWREVHNLEEDPEPSSTDDEDWSYASRLAMEWQSRQQAQQASNNGSTGIKKKLSVKSFRKRSSTKATGAAEKPTTSATPSTQEDLPLLPQIILTYRDQNGAVLRNAKDDNAVVLHALPARVNKKIATAETYALAQAIYLDRVFGRHSYDVATILLDVRPGHGWPNPNAKAMIPFLRCVSPFLHAYFPERLHRTLIYPLPKPALVFWDAARPLLDRAIVDSIALCKGNDGIRCDTPPPTKELCKYLDDSIVETTESKRTSMFVTVAAS